MRSIACEDCGVKVSLDKVYICVRCNKRTCERHSTRELHRGDICLMCCESIIPEWINEWLAEVNPEYLKRRIARANGA